uniref:Ubiquitin-conjugating enzyme E2-18 kDa n=1 Tax=Graphocephala atropunctata TaxID=36148 RepID=A0A1B6M141_9HEMI
MAFSRRLLSELEELRNLKLPYFTNVQVDQSNFLVWQGLVVPQEQPYDKGAFLVEISFAPEYPFKPPRIVFRTKIYHPNVSEDGQICLPLLQPENWKPTTRLEQVIESLVAMIHTPQPEHSLRPDLAAEYLQNRRKFFRVAEQFTSDNAESRP